MSFDKSIKLTDLVNQLGTEVNARKYGEALNSAYKWRQLVPNSIDAHYWVSWLQLSLQQNESALETIKVLTDSGVDDPTFLIHLAKCYQKNGDVEQTIKTANAINLEGYSKVKHLYTLGDIYAQIGDSKRSLLIYTLIVKLRPNDPFAYYQKGVAENHCHKATAAANSFLTAISLKPDLFRAYHMLSNVNVQTPQSNHIDLLENALQTYSMHGDARIFVNLALFKENEDLGLYSRAFKHLKHANDLINRSCKYNYQHELLLTELIQSTFTADFISSRPSNCDSAEPIFIVGMPRTGTTLVEKIIALDDEVYAAGELNNFSSEMANLAGVSNTNINLVELVRKVSEIDFTALGKKYIQSTRPKTGHSKHFIDKMPFNYYLIGAILMALPKAKIIFLSRNPMDTCFSNYKQVFEAGINTASYHLDNIAKQYLLFEQLMQHWQRLFGEQIFQISYEKLVANQEAESKRLIEFCGLSWQDNFLYFHKNISPSATASAAQVRRPIYSSSVNKWMYYRNELNSLLNTLQANGFNMDD